MSNTTIKILEFKNTTIMYNNEYVDENVASLFAGGNEKQVAQSQGRGSVVFFQHNNVAMVLKHYLRGGLVAKLIKNLYLGFRFSQSRAVCEFKLLNAMLSLGLPVPEPVAARVIRSGLFYQASLITKEIEHEATLANACMRGQVSDEIWHEIGACIRLFHDNDVYHADLNAHNILIDVSGSIFLIDFDKGRLRASSDAWKSSNLSRLNRSLEKFKTLESSFHFSESNWNQLLLGYRK